MNTIDDVSRCTAWSNGVPSGASGIRLNVDHERPELRAVVYLDRDLAAARVEAHEWQRQLVDAAIEIRHPLELTLIRESLQTDAAGQQYPDFRVGQSFGDSSDMLISRTSPGTSRTSGLPSGGSAPSPIAATAWRRRRQCRLRAHHPLPCRARNCACESVPHRERDRRVRARARSCASAAAAPERIDLRTAR